MYLLPPLKPHGSTTMDQGSELAPFTIPPHRPVLQPCLCSSQAAGRLSGMSGFPNLSITHRQHVIPYPLRSPNRSLLVD